jgi:hypothetical protein
MLPPSVLQFIALIPEGPAVACAETVTAWLTHTLGFGSFGVLKETLTRSLSTYSVSD